MSHTKANRKWPRQSIWDDGMRQHTGVHPIKCSRCPTTFNLPDRHIKQLPYDMVERRLIEREWTVGKNPAGDLCPACSKIDIQERRQKRNGSKPVLVTTTPAAPPTIVASGNVVSINPQGAPLTKTLDVDSAGLSPAVMTRDDRRTIFAYLNDVYTDASAGYKAPWTDKAVAEHLGVPAPWVATLREENFGPARDNQDIREFLAKADQIKTDIADLVESARKSSNDAHSAITKLKDIQTCIDVLQRKLTKLSDTADIIRKAVTS